jgi:hypothetical protein
MSSTYTFEFHIELVTEDVGKFLLPVYLHIIKSQLPWFAEIQGQLRSELMNRITCEYGALDRAYRRLVVEKNDPTCLSMPKLLPSDLCKLYVALKSSTIHHHTWWMTQSEANERRGTVPYQVLTLAEGGRDKWEEKKIGDFVVYVYAFPIDDTQNVKTFVLNEDPVWSLASDKVTSAEP